MPRDKALRSSRDAVQFPVRLQDGQGLDVSGGGGPPTAAEVRDVGYWSPLGNGNAAAPEIIFANGEPIMVWTTTP